MAALAQRHARSHPRQRHRRPRHQSPRARHHRLQRHHGRRRPQAPRRVLPLVRPPRRQAKPPKSPAAAHAWHGGTGFEGIDWCGGVYSSEWGWSKLLHWLRHNPELRPKFVTALEHCDMVAATLCGITDPDEIPRSVCAMGHKWMWNPRWGGLPPEEFLTARRPAARRRARQD